MKIFLTIGILLFTPTTRYWQIQEISGIVVMGGQPIPGVSVDVMNAGIGTQTNFDGKFLLKISGRETMVVSSEGRYFATVVIEDIRFEDSSFDLGTIPIVHNQIIEIDEYEALDSAQRHTYEEMYRWTELIGYVSNTHVDAAELEKVLWTDRGIKYQYDQGKNLVRIKFQDWRK